MTLKPPAVPRTALLALALTIGPCAASLGQQTDSLRHYDLDEIVVQSGIEKTNTATVQRLSIAELARTNAESVDNFVTLIPGAHLQTNSRGETLVYLRNAGERQVAVFYAGALLNVPWDNRVDLASVPSGAVGAVEVAKGPSSILYGTNVLGGAINLIPRSLDGPGRSSELTGSIGSEGSRFASASHLARRGPWQYGATLDYSRRDGVSVPGDADAPFSQASGGVRTNTDREFSSVHAGVSRELGNATRLGVSFMHNSGEKGVAPESHLEPASGVRYWRYPVIRRTYGIANLVSESDSGRLSAAGWVSAFVQRIDQYDDDTYAELSENQRDNDFALGGRVSYRLIASRRLEALFAANYLYSRHDQRNDVISDSLRIDARYRQDIYSFGSELKYRLSDHSQVSAGGSLDGYVAPDATAEARTSATSISATVGFHHAFAGPWHARASLGRKVRFPTTRELLDTALNRFILNPSLKPESSLLGEAAFGWSSPVISAEVIPFASLTSDTIDQTRVQIDGDTFRQRINLDGSSVVGVEVVGTAQLHRRLGIDFTSTVTRSRGSRDAETIRLPERPAVLATVGINGRTRGGVSLYAQASYIGRSYGQDQDGILIALPTATVADFRVGYLVREGKSGLVIEVFGRVDNAFDASTLPQPGLPGPGRMIRVGATIAR